MTKYLYTILLTLTLSLATVSISLAADVTLSWDPSPSANVQGYNIHYKQDNADLPFDGIGANEGPSPIDAGNNMTTTITGLSDSGTYYFAITAYDGAGNESTYSNVVSSSSSVPELLSPAANATNEPIPVTFQWSTTPDMTYTLYYGTDPDLAAVAIPKNSSPISSVPAQAITMLFLSIVLAFLTPLLLRKRNKLGYASAAFALCLALTACGGSGGGDSTTDTKTTTPGTGGETTPPDTGGGTVTPEFYTVDVGTSDYYQAYDLQSGTTYYWKIVAENINDQSESYTSTTGQFTTENL